MRINWFSPLPPARTEVANYTARLVPILSRHAELKLWTDQPARDLNSDLGAHVRQFSTESLPWEELNRADMNVYHLGNNARWHSGIWQLSRQAPGLLVLHETRLPELLASDSSNASVRGTKSAPKTGSATAAARYVLPVELSTRDPLGVVVHDRDAFDRLHESESVSVLYAPLPHASQVPCPDAAAHTARYAAAGRCRLILFGHIGPNRRLKSVLRALAGFPARHRFQLDIYGDLSQRDEVLDLITELSIEPLVRIHGLVPEETLGRALQRAHLAINLRDPTMGEASAAQLRIWDHALPSLVTPDGWYARLPADAVGFVRPESETEDLHAAFRAFLNDPARFAAQGLAGRRALEASHDSRTYAESLVEFAARCSRDRGRAAFRQVTRRAAAKLMHLAGPRSAALGFDAIAEHVSALGRDPERPSEATATPATPEPLRKAA